MNLCQFHNPQKRYQQRINRYKNRLGTIFIFLKICFGGDQVTLTLGGTFEPDSVYPGNVLCRGGPVSFKIKKIILNKFSQKRNFSSILANIFLLDSLHLILECLF